MLVGELEVGGSAFQRTLGNLSKGFGEFVGGLGKLAAPMAGLFAGFLAVDGAIQGFSETLDLGGTLNDLSGATGESVGDLVILRQAFDNAGLGADAAGDMILKLQDSIAGTNEAGKSTAGALKALGVSAAELRNLPAIGQIEAISKGFAGIADQTQRVQVARDLFGKSGGKALALFGDSEAMDQARRQAGSLAEIMEKNVGSFDRLGDVTNGLKLNFQEFFAGALSKIAPQAGDIGEALASIDFVGIGETVGSLAGMFLQLGEAVSSIAPAINFVSEKLSGIFGSGSTASAGLAEKYRGFSKMNRPEESAAASSGPISALQKIGGGGGFGGGASPQEAQLSETKTQTRLLQQILETQRAGNTGTSRPPEV